jgi:hypothetical protein
MLSVRCSWKKRDVAITHPYAQFDLLAFDVHLMHLEHSVSRYHSWDIIHLAIGTPRKESRTKQLTRKSTPIVALLSSSGSHCSSENRSNRLDFPTDEFPMRRIFTFMGWFALVVVGAMALDLPSSLKRESLEGVSNGFAVR